MIFGIGIGLAIAGVVGFCGVVWFAINFWGG